MTGQDIVFATCAMWPNVSTSDAHLADALRALGHRVRGEAWNSAPVEAFTSADMVVLRSNWDFHHDLDGFRTWLDALDASGVELRNSAELVRAYLDKTYVTQVSNAGFRAPLTLITDDFDTAAIISWADGHGLDRVVVKPAWGASGHDVALVDRGELAATVAQWAAKPDPRALLIQEFIPQISNGEYAVVFFGGEFSHALLRSPVDDDFRVNSQYGGTTTLVKDIDPALLRFAASVEASLPEPATYARIDVVSDGSEHIVMEIEINEPGLGLDLAPESAERFATALLA